jgi:hypothetical protein
MLVVGALLARSAESFDPRRSFRAPARRRQFGRGDRALLARARRARAGELRSVGRRRCSSHPLGARSRSTTPSYASAPAARDAARARDVREHRRRARPVDVPHSLRVAGYVDGSRARCACRSPTSTACAGRAACTTSARSRSTRRCCASRAARRRRVGGDAPPPAAVGTIAAALRVRRGPGTRGRAPPRARRRPRLLRRRRRRPAARVALPDRRRQLRRDDDRPPVPPGCRTRRRCGDRAQPRGTQFHPAVGEGVRRRAARARPGDRLDARRAAGDPGASAPYRIRLVGAGELRSGRSCSRSAASCSRSRASASTRPGSTAAGGALALVGLGLRAVVQVRAGRSAAALHRALGTPTSATRCSTGRCGHVACLAPDMGGLVDWDEDGLGGSLERRAPGRTGPQPSALTSWLVREAESGRDAIVARRRRARRRRRRRRAAAPPREQRPRRLPRASSLRSCRRAIVELALLESLDELGLALAAKPELDGGGSQRRRAARDSRGSARLRPRRLDER